ncbi:MAG: hypothetical protein DSY81_11730 [Bacillota bacterium]|nr:MAG: hypothetical protein DSY81_11730 [Bacillota bacterium]
MVFELVEKLGDDVPQGLLLNHLGRWMGLVRTSDVADLEQQTGSITRGKVMQPTRLEHRLRVQRPLASIELARSFTPRLIEYFRQQFHRLIPLQCLLKAFRAGPFPGGPEGPDRPLGASGPQRSWLVEQGSRTSLAGLGEHRGWWPS